MKRKDTRSYCVDRNLPEYSLERRHEPGFRYCVEAVDHPKCFDNPICVEDPPRIIRDARLALVEYCVRLYGNATIPPPPRHLFFCDNTPSNRAIIETMAETLNEVACRFEARMRGVASSDADDNEDAKQKGKVRE